MGNSPSEDDKEDKDVRTVKSDAIEGDSLWKLNHEAADEWTHSGHGEDATEIDPERLKILQDLTHWRKRFFKLKISKSSATCNLEYLSEKAEAESLACILKPGSTIEKLPPMKVTPLSQADEDHILTSVNQYFVEVSSMKIKQELPKTMYILIVYGQDESDNPKIEVLGTGKEDKFNLWHAKLSNVLKTLKRRSESRDDKDDTTWVCSELLPLPFELRKGPDLDGGEKSGRSLKPGEVFSVCEEKKVDDILYLKLSDGRGWACDHIPSESVVCRRQEPAESGGLCGPRIKERSCMFW